MWAEVTKVLSDPERLLGAASSYVTAIPAAAVDLAANFAQVQKQLETLERRSTETAAEYLWEGLPAALLASALAVVQAELQTLTERRDQLQAVEEMAT